MKTWTITHGDDLEHVISDETQAIAEVYSGEKDALLISAAPDLLSSLESVIFFLEDYLEDSRERDARIAERDNCKGYISAHTENIIRDIKAAKLAIKKAKGELWQPFQNISPSRPKS